jgi:hypothetical protein
MSAPIRLDLEHFVRVVTHRSPQGRHDSSVLGGTLLSIDRSFPVPVYASVPVVVYLVTALCVQVVLLHETAGQGGKNERERMH